MTEPTGRGFFLTFEGGEGSGKSTQVRLLATNLAEAGWDVVTTREPGGSPVGEALRGVLLDGSVRGLGDEMEALLFAAARADHVDSLIRPALDAGSVVICDRFVDSTRVYQDAAQRKDPVLFSLVEAATTSGVLPDLTLLLDLPASEGLARAAARRGSAQADRFEGEETELHEKRRDAFLAIAAAEPGRCRVVDAARPVETVARDIRDIVTNLLTVRDVQSERRAGPA